MKYNPLLTTDFYKIVHHKCYVPSLTKSFAYWTPRMSRFEDVNDVVMFGLQGVIKEILIEGFNENFFNKPKEDILNEYVEVITSLESEDSADCEHIAKLHDLGYLPIEIKAISEGTLVPIKVPMFEISNTHDDFGWLPNSLETLLSCNIWQSMTSATIAHRYRKLVNTYFEKTVDDTSLASRACGDFSMRGMSSDVSAMRSGTGHLMSFISSATIPSALYLRDYYNCSFLKDVIAKGTCSTEHSIMSSYLRDKEIDCYKRLITEVFPKGVLSIVSDTYDYWGLITEKLPQLKEDIMNRNGKIVIRGDSGDPIKIICGDNEANIKSPEFKGTVELLWDIFGGTINSKGYKVLDSHIGAIYGDSITFERATEIYRLLEEKGFAVNNVVLGVGSYSFQYNTRDSLGFGLKLTDAIVNGVERQIYKDPKTDNGNFKKSQKGRCVVFKDENGYIKYKDELNSDEADSFNDNLLEVVFRDGKMIKEQSLQEIRNRLNKGKF